MDGKFERFVGGSLTWGERVLAVRQAWGWSSVKLAEEVGCNVRTVRHWEARGSEPVRETTATKAFRSLEKGTFLP